MLACLIILYIIPVGLYGVPDVLGSEGSFDQSGFFLLILAFANSIGLRDVLFLYWHASIKTNLFDDCFNVSLSSFVHPFEHETTFVSISSEMAVNEFVNVLLL